MKPVPEVIECSVVGPNTARVRFRDGLVSTLNLAPALHGPVFEALRRPERFREVAVDGGTLVWPNGADICPSVLRYWCELGRVCTQKELDAHFAASQLVTSAPLEVAEAKAKYAAKRKKRAAGSS